VTLVNFGSPEVLALKKVRLIGALLEPTSAVEMKDLTGLASLSDGVAVSLLIVKVWRAPMALEGAGTKARPVARREPARTRDFTEAGIRASLIVHAL
jgi:hypothetical protein